MLQLSAPLQETCIIGHFMPCMKSLLTPTCPSVSIQVVMDDGESYPDTPSKPQSDDALVEHVIHQHGLTTIKPPSTSTMSLEEELSEQDSTPIAEHLCIHQKQNHLSFRSIQLMASNGHYATRLVDLCVPKCSTCLFGKSTC